MSDSNNGNGAPKDLDVAVKEIRNAINELSSKLEAMESARPVSFTCGGCGGCGCGGCGCGGCRCGGCRCGGCRCGGCRS